MQAGLAVLILYDIKFFAVNGKMSAADTVRISADDLTLIVRTLDMTLEIVEADENILEIAVSVGRKKRLPGCAVCNDGRTDAVCVLELDISTSLPSERVPKSFFEIIDFILLLLY